MLGGRDSCFNVGGLLALIIRLGAVEYESTLPVRASVFLDLSKLNFPLTSVGGVSFFRSLSMFGVSRCGLNVASNSAKPAV